MIEKELFSHYSIDEKKLLAYGFQPEGHMLVYSQDLETENFRIIMTYDRALCGKIIDLAFGEEYVNFRMESATGYSAEIRNKFEVLLLDIRDKCCKNQYFQSEQARRINEFIYETYDVMPEFLWPNIPSYAAFRKKQGGKWFAVIGSVPRRKVDPISLLGEDVEVINVKVDKDQIDVQRILNTDGMLKSERKICAVINNAKCSQEVRAEFGSFCNYLWAYTDGKTIVYNGHAQGRVPVSNGLSDRISKDLKNRGFKYIGTVMIYSHLQACGMINDHAEDCPCFHQINASHPCIHLPPDQEAQLMTLRSMPQEETEG